MLEEVREALDLALRRLLALKRPDGSWESAFEISAFLPSLYVIMLRTTGLIESPGARENEIDVLRHMVTLVNDDGGFFAYPGSPSSRSLTRLARAAVLLVLGEIPPGCRDPRWFQANRGIGGDLKSALDKMATSAAGFLKARRAELSLVEFMHPLSARFLAAYAGADPPPKTPLLFGPEMLMMIRRSPSLSKALGRVNYLARVGLPALSILSRKTMIMNPALGPLCRSLLRARRLRDLQDRSIQSLAETLLSTQNRDGGWNFNPFNTMLNIMALREAGLRPGSPCLIKGFKFLRDNQNPAEDGGVFFALFKCDVWNTALALGLYLSVPGNTCEDPAIRDSLEFLLGEQNRDGSFSFAGGSENDPDNDSTAAVLRALSVAVRTAQPSLRSRIHEAVQRALRFLVPNQQRNGGFSAFGRGIWRRAPRSPGSLSQSLLDFPTSDQTVRALAALLEAGVDSRAAPDRRGPTGPDIDFFANQRGGQDHASNLAFVPDGRDHLRAGGDRHSWAAGRERREGTRDTIEGRRPLCLQTRRQF